MLLAFDDDGPGPAVVLLHALGLDRTMWEMQTTTLGSVYRLITPDLRGHGQSPSEWGIATVDDLADDVVELLDRLGLATPVTVGGCSLGGYVALSLALRYPDRLNALILIDTRAAADTAAAARTRDEQAAAAEAAGNIRVLSENLPMMFSASTRSTRPDLMGRMAEVMAAANPVGIASVLRGMAVRPDRTPALGTIRVPTLVIAGEDDQLVPADEARAMAEAIPGARLETIPDAGHLAPLENPAAVNAAIAMFLTSIP